MGRAVTVSFPASSQKVAAPKGAAKSQLLMPAYSNSITELEALAAPSYLFSTLEHSVAGLSSSTRQPSLYLAQ